MTFVPCAIPICYRGPDHPHFITERDVRTALDFLVAVAATPAGVSAGGVAGWGRWSGRPLPGLAEPR